MSIQHTAIHIADVGQSVHLNSLIELIYIETV